MKNVVLMSCLFSAAVFAQTECEVNLNGKVELQNEQLTIGLSETSQVVFTADSVHIDGKKQRLNNEQQKDATAYYMGLTQTASDAAGLGLKGLDIAHGGLVAALSELLGEDAPLVNQLSSEITTLRNQIATGIYDDAGKLRFNLSGDDGEEWLDDILGEPVEEKMQGIMQRAMGGLMMALGSQMMMNGGMGDFEQKMEAFSQRMEQDFEAQGAALEQEGEALCQRIKALNSEETRLSQSVPGLEGLNIIRL